MTPPKIFCGMIWDSSKSESAITILIARLEVDPEEMARLFDADLRQQISDRLKSLGYVYVAVELGGYKSGSLNARLKA